MEALYILLIMMSVFWIKHKLSEGFKLCKIPLQTKHKNKEKFSLTKSNSGIYTSSNFLNFLFLDNFCKTTYRKFICNCASSHFIFVPENYLLLLFTMLFLLQEFYSTFLLLNASEWASFINCGYKCTETKLQI